MLEYGAHLVAREHDGEPAGALRADDVLHVRER
jgi:hypothetical protein